MISLQSSSTSAFIRAHQVMWAPLLGRRRHQSANPAGVAKKTPTPTPKREQAAGGGGCSQSSGLFLINQAAPHPDIGSSNDDRSVPLSSSGCLKSRQTSPDSSIADPGSKHTIE
ncbi:uncharacterized protein LOC142796196 [Rhipicephalus microplus]|uniref:uncharacterized protein LOC142796196 n=1 Tax=Rhipicephalus microplus TaxID=6941 RepID=UPI003F6BF2BD